jgi:hypothetical protein
MNPNLRLTDTNAASDSQGRTWGLEGNLIWWLIGGLGAGIALFFVLIVTFKTALLASFGIAVVPVLVCLGYIFGLRQGKPPGYDRDCFEHWLGSRGFGPEANSHLRHPLADEASSVSNLNGHKEAQKAQKGFVPLVPLVPLCGFLL